MCVCLCLRALVCVCILHFMLRRCDSLWANILFFSILSRISSSFFKGPQEEVKVFIVESQECVEEIFWGHTPGQNHQGLQEAEGEQNW